MREKEEKETRIEAAIKYGLRSLRKDIPPVSMAIISVCCASLLVNQTMVKKTIKPLNRFPKKKAECHVVLNCPPERRSV